MILFRNYTAQVIATEGTAFTLVGQNPNGITVMLENKDSLNYISYRFQSSADSSSFADVVAGAGNISPSGILEPGGKVMITLAVSDAYVRLLCSSSGGAQLDAGIVQFAGNSSKTFTLGLL